MRTKRFRCLTSTVFGAQAYAIAIHRRRLDIAASPAYANATAPARANK